jgi:hypothetical protein
MPSNRRKARMIVSLTLAVLATSTLVVPRSQAGPISDMIARHRQNQQMKLPPVDKPFSTKPVRDLNARNTSLKDRFKKRFSLNRSNSTGGIPLNSDSGVVKTSR